VAGRRLPGAAEQKGEIFCLPGLVEDRGQICFSRGSLPCFFLHVRVLREIAFGSATREGIAFGSIWDVRVVNSLVDMYAKCGSMDDAWRVFNKMPSRDVVTWTAVLGGCALHGHGKEALKHFKWMCKEGVQLDDITFISLLSARSHAGLVDEGMRCYASMVRLYDFCKIGTLHLYGRRSWPCWPSTGGRE